MKRLIIIGNGFDLAHGLRTSYKDFLKYYWQSVTSNYNDELFSLSCRDETLGRHDTFQELKEKLDLIDRQWLGSANIKWEFKNSFFNKLNNLANSDPKWVDIEMLYYEFLKHHFRNKKFNEIRKLNLEFENVKKVFEAYIVHVVNSKKSLEKHYLPDIGALFEPYEFQSRKMLNLEKKLTKNGLDSLRKLAYSPRLRSISNVHLLTFNYTDTLEVYQKHLKKNAAYFINHIHGEAGKVENPIVFGFGDERDVLFNEMEDANENEFLRFMKSSAYLRTRNYFDLITFIESDDFIVEIMGHSCALSDRTLLKTIFEHQNCKYIQIYYHQNEGDNNFNDLNLNISRHFDDKKVLRQKVANKVFSEALPQFRA